MANETPDIVRISNDAKRALELWAAKFDPILKGCTVYKSLHIDVCTCLVFRYLEIRE